jgi:SpoIID/LytB domain protein
MPAAELVPAARPRHRRPAAALAVGALVSGLVLGVAQPAAAADQVFPVPASGSYTISGKGFGHGNGMSQYGAKGAATRGVSAKAITDFYYPGTVLTTQADPMLRVRLAAVEARPVAVAAQPGLVATDGAGKRWTLASNTTSWRILQTTADKFALQRVVGGAYATAYTVPGPVVVGGPATITVQFLRGKGDCKGLSAVTYAGTLRTLSDAGVQRSAAVLRRDHYLRGVVPSESPSSWPAAALQAQTIAARSYAAFQTSSSRWYDVWDTTRDQCWDGAAAHVASTDKAITATAGQIRTYRGAPAFTQFSSSNGGYLASGSQPYLVAKADPYEQYSGNPNADWTKAVSVAAIRQLAGLATVTRVRITSRDGNGAWGGRVKALIVDGATSTGAAASKAISGNTFRLSLGLRSTYFSLGTPAVTPPAVTPAAAPAPQAFVPTVWRRSTQTFYPKGGTSFRQGALASTLLAIDGNGDGKVELTTFDRSTARWTVQGATPFGWGVAGDIPVTGDRAGDQRSDVGVFRPSSGTWLIRGEAAVPWGARGDVPLLRDFTGDGKADIMVYRPSNSTWYLKGGSTVAWGRRGDVPVPADYNGDGKTEIAVYRPSNATWYVYATPGVIWGRAGDVPVPGDYDRDGKAEFTVYRPSTCFWYPMGQPSFNWGMAGDYPLAPPE